MTRRDLLSTLPLAACACPPLNAAAVPDRTVVLSFDDAVLSHATFVAPLLKTHRFAATFFICEFPPDFNDQTKYMSWDQIRDLHRMGFEIGSHSRTHTHVTKMTRGEFSRELAYIEEKCASYGIPKPTSFAYPAYETDPAALPVLRERGYRFARAGGSRPYDPKLDDPLLIPSFSTTGDNKSRVLAALRQASGGKIVVFTIHGVPDAAHPSVTTPPALFEGYLHYMAENRFTAIAVRDLARYTDLPKTKESL